MDILFLTFAVLVALLVGAALFSKSDIVRGAVIAALLLGAFVAPFMMERAAASAQGQEVIPLLHKQDCRALWSLALSDGHERLNKDIRVMFLFSAALAIIAAVPRRNRKPGPSVLPRGNAAESSE